MPPLAALARSVFAPCALALLAAAAPAQGSNLHVFDREDVLGTSMHLVVRGDETSAKQAESVVVAEIERLAAILSRHDATSELSKLRLAKEPVRASSDLREVLRAAQSWMELTHGAFHPGVQGLSDLWTAAVKRGTRPTDAELAAARAKLPAKLWEIDDAATTVRPLSDVPVTLDAIGKGYVLDRATQKAQKLDGVKGLVLVIGGDLRVRGSDPGTVDVVDPRAPAENAPKLCTVRIRHAAAATSGGYARGFGLGGKHLSHILDPRTGEPVTKILQATVVAPEAMRADALATILNVLPIEEGLALVAKEPNTSCLIVDANGKQHASPGWADLVVGPEGAAKKAEPARAPKPELPQPSGPQIWLGGELKLAFELAKPAQEGGEGRRRGGGYKRPYVAAWLEDESGKPVRTLTLWIEDDRWVDDLRRWAKLYRGHRRDADAVTRATRSAGKYELGFDGLDDQGEALPAGKYTVLLEVVREHGTYQLVKHAIDANGAPFDVALEGAGTELASARVTFTKSEAPKK
ncbi:MAG: DUF2271 domain-containing protein [Planctomycetes bacterium]|nr:DUF2271 domain-containing protein [Planctomycetota bacterium]